MAKEEVKKLVPNGGYPMHTFDDVKDIYYLYISNPEDRALIEKAYLLAKGKHENQFRRSGEPYIQHPIEVAYIIAKLQGGPATIASGFLHDVVEDTDVTIEEIQRDFGEDVAKIVDALTKIQRLKLSKRTEAEFEAEDHRKIFLGMAQDVRVIIVKLADRVHNMRTLDALKPERQIALAQETLDVFVPIAHRLGINNLQSELQDLSLKYLEPDAYKEILKLVDEKCENRTESLSSLKKRVADILFEHKIPFRMESRVKSIYSIYKKMFQKGHSFDDIYDVMAIRIITETELNCYEILGIIHSTYKPIPGRFKDYIAMPKPNMYQSLHTSIVSGDGQIYEIQIRTEEMDQVAETGIAAHWKYKEGTHYNAKEEQKEIEEKLHWFRDFVSISSNQTEGAKEYMDTLTSDIFGANVYVFTPLGRVIDLPTGATPLDFAYKIHTKVGDSAVGAIINGMGVPLNTVLKTGDVCEIRTSKTAPGPNASWLEIAKTASAKGHIRRAIQKKEAEMMREENIRNGRQSVVESFRAQGIEEDQVDGLLDNNNVLAEFGAKTLEDLYVAVAGKNPAPGALVDYLGIRKKYEPDLNKLIKDPSKMRKDDDKSPVNVAGGVTNLAIALAQCCNPVPGDPIVGYITKGKGITVHRKECPNISSSSKRLIDVNWKEDLGIGTYPVQIDVYSVDRPNLLSELLSLIGAHSLTLSGVNGKAIPQNGTCVLSLTVNVPSAKTLEDVIQSLKGVRGVTSIQRIVH
ncbi:MAG: bifunctional (p)ppGpp synthetase/guanosine-3',5'-bis(diphosphate) 3'-pyrophosphohydrolase [Bacilli bacterium]|nr:bifunctional (p)ppGpp synthetase/guanosine-3',5'-bis(diphosphate) 3'-pyrophosphohydrolase [Bacilli bacterium]